MKDTENKYLIAVLESLNTQVQILKTTGMPIHDEDDFEYVVDYIYWSTAQERLIVKFKNKGEVEE
jgi:hypothetical protein